MDQAKSQAPSYAGHIHRDVTRRDGDLTITLEFEARFLRRKRMATDCGMAFVVNLAETVSLDACLLYTSPSPRDRTRSRMPSSA